VTENVGVLDPRLFDNVNIINCNPPPRDNSYIGVIVLGCVVAVILIIACIWFFKKRQQMRKGRAGTKAPIYDSENGSHTLPLEEMQTATGVRRELPGGRLYRFGSLASELTDEPRSKIDRRESTSTVTSQQRLEPPRFPNIFTYIPELDHEGQPHELGAGERQGHQEGDLSPLSDRISN
jgi:hypothetical protein